MPVSELCDLTWEEAEALVARETVAILPVGAIEAHGPHLPLDTDVIIAQAMARSAADRLAARGSVVVLLPPLAYTAAGYASAFPGTISLRPDTVSAVLDDVAHSLSSHGFGMLAIANAHLDPQHVASIQSAVERIDESGAIAVAFPDLTSKPWALRLSDEFKSGACHAGQYETSVVMAARPEAVRDALRVELPDNPASLSQAIRAGHATFIEAGGPRAYFGYPARATVREGEETIEILGAILEEAVVAALERHGST
jgi:creatinine amidohydrolase